MSAADWTPERIAILRRLVSSGLSYSKIAAQLGGITRCAAIGKAHRLGIARDNQPAPSGKPRRAKRKDAPRRPEASTVRFMDRRSGQCAHPLWVYGTPLEEKRCCGNPCPPQPERQACEFHRRMYAAKRAA